MLTVRSIVCATLLCIGMPLVIMSLISLHDYYDACTYLPANCITYNTSYEIRCLGVLCTCSIKGIYTSPVSTSSYNVTLINPFVAPNVLTKNQCNKWKDNITTCYVKTYEQDTIGYTSLNSVPIYVSFAAGWVLFLAGILFTIACYGFVRLKKDSSYNYIQLSPSKV
jgi:hypothetical protein